MIEDLLAEAENPCVLLSGGLDSVFLLDLVRSLKPDIACVTFRQDWTPKQWGLVDRLIKEWDLQVTHIPPAASYLIPNGEELSVVDEYVLGDQILPVVRDLVHAERCFFDLGGVHLARFPWDHDVVFVGTREEDFSVATGRPLKNAITELEGWKLCAPLFYWSREDVVRAAKGKWYADELLRADEESDTGNLMACHACLKGEQAFCPKEQRHIEPVAWDREKSLKLFREKFGFCEVGNNGTN